MSLNVNTKIQQLAGKGFSLLALLFCVLDASFAKAQKKDSSLLLQKVIVRAAKKQNFFTAITPTQSLNRQTLQAIAGQSLGDAARFFAGVLVKDYGGVGGLKTVSVRSLGAAHTGIIYDGIPVADAQTGQVDLSRFSSTFTESLELQQGNIQQMLAPARNFAAAAALSIITTSFHPKDFDKNSWQAGIKAGSFGLLQPYAGVCFAAGRHTLINANLEALSSNGHYPFYIDNGGFSEKTRRGNSNIRSQQGEFNIVKQFADSAVWQTKLWGYYSKRGLPGAIIFFNSRSVQELWNRNFFAQTRYTKKISRASSILISARYSRDFTRYTDPDYLNNQGGIDSRYQQQEGWLSLAGSHAFGRNFLLSAASDASLGTLSANTQHFAGPLRLSLWNNIALGYSSALLRVNSSLLYTHIHDKVKMGTAPADRNEITPGIAVSISPVKNTPLQMRLFYKRIFRVPTFNDLYYNFIGNNQLKPEYTNQYNAGFTWSKLYAGHLNQFSISMDGYYNSVKDKIIAVPNKNLFVWTMLNLGTVHIKGIDISTELSGKITAALGWNARVAYTWQQARDLTDPASSTYKNRIPYTPDHSGSGLLALHFKSWGAGYSLLFSGKRYTLGENNAANQINGWATHDVFITRQVIFRGFSTTVKGAADNISNKYYDVVRYYPMPGRSFSISLLFHHL